MMAFAVLQMQWSMADEVDTPEPAPSFRLQLEFAAKFFDKISTVDLSDADFCLATEGWVTLIRMKPDGYYAYFKKRFGLQSDSFSFEAKIDDEVAHATIGLWASWLRLARYGNQDRNRNRRYTFECYAAARGDDQRVYEGIFVDGLEQLTFSGELTGLVNDLNVLTRFLATQILPQATLDTYPGKPSVKDVENLALEKRRKVLQTVANLRQRLNEQVSPVSPAPIIPSANAPSPPQRSGH